MMLCRLLLQGKQKAWAGFKRTEGGICLKNTVLSTHIRLLYYDLDKSQSRYKDTATNACLFLETCISQVQTHIGMHSYVRGHALARAHTSFHKHKHTIYKPEFAVDVKRVLKALKRRKQAINIPWFLNKRLQSNILLIDEEKKSVSGTEKSM